MLMKIAVVIPVYNVAPYLRRCLDSVAVAAREVEKRGGGGQRTDRSSVEIVCVDDGSTDGSGEILDTCALNPQPPAPNSQPALRILHQSNAGQSAARNAALDLLERESFSGYVTFVDSDDWVAPSYLEELCKGLAAGADVAGVMLRRVPNAEADAAGGVFGSEPPVWQVDAPRAYWALPGYYQSAAGGKLYDFRLFDGIRYPVGQVTEDEATLYRLFFRAKKVAHTSSALYAYRVREDSTMGIAWSPRRLDRLQAWRDQIRFFGELGYDELVANSRKGLVGDLTEAVRNLKACDGAKRIAAYRSELAEQLEAGRLAVDEFYLAYKAAHPFRIRVPRALGGFA